MSSVIDSDDHKTTKVAPPSSLRRTLSADMMSSRSGLSVVIDSSCLEDEGDNNGEEEAPKNNIIIRPSHGRHFDSWFSPQMQNQRSTEPQLPPPYVHPLVKRSASAVSLQSLEACTESLGSESGSDGFSFSLPAAEEEPHDDQRQIERTRRKRHPRPFPPPLASLSYQDGQPLHVRSHRNELGRLVLEATTVPNYLHSKNFQAQRENGRLVLAFADQTSSDRAVVEQEQVEDIEEEEEEEEEEDSLTRRMLKGCKDPRSSLHSSHILNASLMII